MRAPVGVSSREAFEASLTSPPPVNPEPWKKSARPMPRSVPRQALRFARKSLRFTASRSTFSALQSFSSFCPVAVVSPGRKAFVSRSRTGSISSASAIRSICTSAANCVCGAPKPAERAVRRRVGPDDAAVDADVVAPVRPRRVDHAAGEDDRRQRHVGAAVQEDVDLDGRQPSVPRDAGPVPDDARMPLRRRDHVLDAVVHELDRTARLDREDGGVPRDHGGVLLLAAESAAGLGLDDADLLLRQVEEHPEGPVDVVRTLERAVNGDPAVLRDRDDAVRLDVELLLQPDAVLPLDDAVRLGEAAAEVPLLDHDFLEAEVRLRGVVDRRGGNAVDADAGFRLDQLFPVLVSDQKDRLGEVADLALGETGLVELDQRDRVAARDVAEVRDREARAVEVAAGSP